MVIKILKKYLDTRLMLDFTKTDFGYRACKITKIRGPKLRLRRRTSFFFIYYLWSTFVTFSTFKVLQISFWHFFFGPILNFTCFLAIGLKEERKTRWKIKSERKILIHHISTLKKLFLVSSNFIWQEKFYLNVFLSFILQEKIDWGSEIIFFWLDFVLLD